MKTNKQHWVVLTRAPRGWRHFVALLWECINRRPKQGHRVLIQSTIRSLREYGVTVQLNPLFVLSRCTHVLLTNGSETLDNWTKIRRQNHPQVWIGMLPTIADAGSRQMQATAEATDNWATQLAASDWHRHLIITAHPILTGRTHVWPCGVDTRWWKPDTGKRRDRHLLVYEKRVSNEVIDAFEKKAEELGWTIKRISYGHYSPETFRSVLSLCSASLFFSEFESQGIALAEAWACDVPTLVWKPDPRNPWPYTAPWLCAETGQVVHRPSDLSHALALIETCHPRAWVESNMSIRISGEIMLGISSATG